MRATNYYLPLLVLSAAIGVSACGSEDGSAGGNNATKTGVIRSVAGNEQAGTINVDGSAYSYTAATFKSDDANAPAVGMVVSVEAGGNSVNGVTEADNVTYDAKIEGLVTANNLASGGELEVMGQVVTIDAATVFESDDSNMTVDSIPVGAIVEVSGLSQDDGSVMATRIEVKNAQSDKDGDEMEVEGIVSAIGDSSISIGNMSFMIDANTYFDDELTFDSIMEGMMVEIEFVMDGDQPLAIKVEAEDMHDEDEMDDGDMDDDDGDSEEMEYEGEVTAVSETSITVGDTEIGVNDLTIFHDHGDGSFTLADIQVGDVVEVEAMTDGTGALVAIKIEVEHDDSASDMTGDDNATMDPPVVDTAPAA